MRGGKPRLWGTSVTILATTLFSARCGSKPTCTAKGRFVGEVRLLRVDKFCHFAKKRGGLHSTLDFEHKKALNKKNEEQRSCLRCSRLVLSVRYSPTELR